MGILFGSQRAWIGEKPIPAYPGAPNDYMNSAGEMAVPTVYACVSLVSEIVGMLVWERIRRRTVVNAALPVIPFLEMPEPGVLPINWKASVIASGMLRGNTIGEILDTDSNNLPTAIVLLNWDSVVPIDIPGRPLRFRLADGRVEGVWPYGNLWHMPALTMPGSRIGLSAIAKAAAAMGIDVNARRFAADFFNGSNIPKALLTTTAGLDQAQAKTAKDRVISATTSREPLVLGGDWKYQALTVSPNEAQFLETQKFSVAQICRFFKVAPEMIGGANDGNSMTYSNRENRSIDFLTYTIQPWLTRFEEALYPVFPSKQGVRFKVGELLRTDAETQARVHNQMIAGKYFTPTEARAERGLPPMTLDQLEEVNLVPLTVTPMGGVKALPALTDPAGDPADLPDGDDPSNEKEPVNG